MARPREWDRAELREAFLQYIETTEIPIVAEFAHNHGISRDQLYAMEELSDAVKGCTTKKESALERQALTGKVNVSMAIFSLKQLGWTDRAENTLKGDPNAPVALELKGSDVHG